MSAEGANRVFANLEKKNLEQAARNALYDEIRDELGSAELELEEAYLELEKFRQRIRLLGEEDLDSDEKQRYADLPTLILDLEEDIVRLKARAERIQGD